MNELNSVLNLANIIIDLSQVWEVLVPKYAHICMNITLQIPTLDQEDTGKEIKTMTQTDITESVHVNQIADQKVVLQVSC